LVAFTGHYNVLKLYNDLEQRRSLITFLSAAFRYFLYGK
jgi:hypothetical protein